jgi:hypothetical protein
MSTALCCRRSRPQLLRSDYDGHRLSSGPTCRVLTKTRQISRRLTHAVHVPVFHFLFLPSFLLHFFPLLFRFFFWSIAIGPLLVGAAKKSS